MLNSISCIIEISYTSFCYDVEVISVKHFSKNTPVSMNIPTVARFTIYGAN